MSLRPPGEILAGLERLGVRLGLEPLQGLLERLGNPERGLVAVLIAGTNGKGSTAAMLASVARAAGLRTGLYTSPHLQRVEERIRIDGEPIDSALLAAALERVLAAVRHAGLETPTYFEAATAAAFLLFAEARIELAVLEVGLGGRLDATNLSQPIVSVVTPIALDHTEWLGETLAAVAREKAGVMRAGRPAVLGPQEPEAERALLGAAREIGARPVDARERARVLAVAPRGLAGSRFEVELDAARLEIDLPLAGEHQVENAAVAIAAAATLAGEGFPALDAGAIRRGLAAVRWPGRLESLTLPGGRATVLLDAAHNPHGVAALARFLAGLGRRFVLVFGALADKDFARMLAPLAANASAVVLTRPESPRALDPARLRALLADPAGARLEPDPALALTTALGLADTSGVDLVVVAGSIYLIAAARRELARRGAPGAGS
jgi:dihydrofolate synthase/folylpolyglutamate synthase